MKKVKQLKIMINENKLKKIEGIRLSHLINDLLDIYIALKQGKKPNLIKIKEKIKKNLYKKEQ